MTDGRATHEHEGTTGTEPREPAESSSRWILWALALGMALGLAIPGLGGGASGGHPRHMEHMTEVPGTAHDMGHDMGAMHHEVGRPTGPTGPSPRQAAVLRRVATKIRALGGNGLAIDALTIAPVAVEGRYPVTVTGRAVNRDAARVARELLASRARFPQMRVDHEGWRHHPTVCAVGEPSPTRAGTSEELACSWGWQGSITP